MLTHKPDPRPQWNPALYEFVPAPPVRHPRHLRRAPLVAIGRKPRGDYRETLSMAHVYYGITALARFDARRWSYNILFKARFALVSSKV